MDETKSGVGCWGIVIVIFLLFIVCGNGWGNGFFGGRGGFGPAGFGGFGAEGYGFQNYKATCNSEKQEIINAARTQYLTEQQSALTRETISADGSQTRAKIDFYAYQDLRDKLSETQRENLVLQNKLFVKDQLAPITAQLSAIQCNMLKRPDITGVGVACPNAAILNGLGVNTLNGCGCGCNGMAN